MRSAGSSPPAPSSSATRTRHSINETAVPNWPGNETVPGRPYFRKVKPWIGRPAEGDLPRRLSLASASAPRTGTGAGVEGVVQKARPVALSLFSREHLTAALSAGALFQFREAA